MSGVNKFYEKGQGKIHHVFADKKKVTPLLKKTLLTSEKVTTSEEVEKDTKNLDNMKEAVVTIRMKDLDKFEVQYKGSKGWINLDHEF